jgi:hypothetical protein
MGLSSWASRMLSASEREAAERDLRMLRGLQPAAQANRSGLQPKAAGVEPEAVFCLAERIVHRSISPPSARACASQSAKSSGVRVQRLGDQLLADLRPVAIGCIDEVHTEGYRPPGRRHGLLPVRRLAPGYEGDAGPARAAPA